MIIKLIRVYFADNYTIGHLYFDDVKICDTLEDKVRTGKKVKNQTAIPIGTYSVIVNYSTRFKKMMPLLLNVPNFEGIRIHSGNDETDTSGCILVGLNSVKGKVLKSRDIFLIVFSLINNALNSNENVTLEIIEQRT